MDKLKEMQGIIQTLKDDNVALMKENASLKRQIGGYKTANENYKKQVAELKERVGHYKALDLEGDHLYEEKIAELGDAKKEIERKNAFIEQLQEKAQNLMVDNSKLKGTVSMNESVINELEETIDELSKPWWKRIFK